MAAGRGGLVLPAALLVAVQVLHGAVPGPPEHSGPPVGPVVGLALLLSATVALVAALQRAAWACPLLRWTGWAVAVGFLLYHGLPVTSPLTEPYWGRPNVGPVQWLPVLLAIAMGAWAASSARPTPGRARVPAG